MAERKASAGAPGVVSIPALAAGIAIPYHNSVVAAVNDHVVRMSVMTGPFFWHCHPDSDESFYVIEGTVAVELDNERIELSPGDMLTIPAGVAHRTSPVGGRSVNITIERRDAATVELPAPDR